MYYMKMSKGLSLGTILVYLSILRIIICLLPQNNWYKKEGNHNFALIRNTPFALIGIIAVLLAFENSFIYIGILIIFSFIFYLPVALYGKKYPKLGMLMIPKTICYMLIISYLL